MSAAATLEQAHVSRSAAGFLHDLSRNRDLARAVEGNDLICWTTDEDDVLLTMDGAAAPHDRGGASLVGRPMTDCPYSVAYFRAKEILFTQPGRDQVRVRWKLGRSEWIGTFTRLYTAGGRFRGIAAVAMPLDDAVSLI